MAEPKRKWVTDPEILKQLNAEEPKRKMVTDPDVLRMLNEPDPAPANDAKQPAMPTMDPMGNPIGGDIAPPAPETMSYGDQMGRIGSLADNAIRLLANGLTFGQADRIAGGMDALTGKEPSYSIGVDAQHARTQALRDASPVTSAVVEGAGGLVGGLGLMKNGATLIGRFGPSLAGRAGAAGLEGALYGAAHGAGNTYTENPMDYVNAAGKGAAVGGALGVGLPILGDIASGAFTLARNFGSAPVGGMSRGASGLLRTAASADEAGVRALNGDSAMLVDAGPSMLGLGQGAVTGNGPGKTELVNALRQRDVATGTRLAQAADDNLGRAPIPSQVEAQLAGNRAAVAEGYTPVMEGARAVDTRPLADNLETLAVSLRGPQQRAVQNVRRMLDVTGAPGQLDPSPQTLMATRQAIDGLLANEANPQVTRQLTLARQQVDDALAAAAPGLKAVDARFAELSRQSEGLQRGSQVFDTGKTAIRPVELADEMRTAALPQGEMIGPSAVPVRVREGARAEIDRAVGTSANDLNAIERKLGTADDWNSQKASELFGQTPMQRFMQAVADERNRRSSYQNIVQGSQTAQRTAAGQTLEGGNGMPMDTTLTGLAAKMTSTGFKALMGLTRANTKEEVARALAQSGDPARALGELLLLQRQATGETARVLNRVLGAPEAIGAATPALGQR